MNQVAIGQFIAESRRAKGLTQMQLADVLSISDKTVSKWERGKGLPEVSLMLPLCKTLGISVNELLSGERLESERYFEKAEENMMSLVDRTSPKAKVCICNIACTLVVLSALALCLIAGFVSMPIPVRLLLIGCAVLSIAAVVAVVTVVAVNTEVFICRQCGEKFVPTLFDYVWGPHTARRRYLRCPHCGKKSWNESRIRE